uniref:Uncharacterized protein n=1 Tax=viral metagenome TaxID=1070528 RepID=A0A6M3LNM5_9ZZZZ
MSDLEYPHLANVIRSHLDSDLEYSMSQWIEEEGIPDTEFLAMARDAELGAAWAEAEAALPDNFGQQIIGDTDWQPPSRRRLWAEIILVEMIIALAVLLVWRLA